MGRRSRGAPSHTTHILWVYGLYGYMGCGSGRFFLMRSSLAGGLRAALVTPYPALVTPVPALAVPNPPLVTLNPPLVTPVPVAYPFDFTVGGAWIGSLSVRLVSLAAFPGILWLGFCLVAVPL